MATKAQDNVDHLFHEDAAFPSVYRPMSVEFDTPLVPNAALTRYVKVKLNAVAPWLAHSSSYQHAFEEVLQLCQSGYDFNLIVYDQPAGHYIASYERAKSSSTPKPHRMISKRRRFRRYWQRLRRWRRRQVPRMKYSDEILMIPGKRKWVEASAGRFIVVPEGILRCNPANFGL